MLIYEDLGDRIDRAFDRVNRDERSFPRIAADALREARIPERSGADDVLDWLFAAPSIPAQNDLAEAFGEPPITVYRSRDFHVEILFWLRNVTTIHTHGFSGAFQALAGDRLQTRHAFDERDRVNARLLFGDVRYLGAELIRPGDVWEITNDLAHALVHLEAPSATIVVRTASDPYAGPQYDYRAPSLAWDAFHLDELRARKIQGLRLLCRLGRPVALDRAAEVVASSDLPTCVAVLDEIYRGFGSPDRFAKVLDVARDRHGERRVAEVMSVLREERRLRAVQSLRRFATTADQRFFLALLHHVPTLDAMRPLVEARLATHLDVRRSKGKPRVANEKAKAPAPELEPDPILDALESLAASLTGVDRIGADLDDPFTRALFRSMLRAGTPEAIRRDLARTFDPSEIEARSEAIDRHADRLRGTVLAPLFRSSVDAHPRPRAACAPPKSAAPRPQGGVPSMASDRTAERPRTSSRRTKRPS